MRFVKTDPRAITPTRANANDAGLDIYALEDVNIQPGEVLQIKTGLSISLENDEVGLFWGKSGRAWKNGWPVGLSVLAGCIDAGYRGELLVVVTNSNVSFTFDLINYYLSEEKYGEAVLRQNIERSIIHVPYGQAICQLLIMNCLFPTLEEVTELDVTDRGSLGFGSTDK